MNRTILAFGLSALFFLRGYAAETAEPPRSIHVYLEWCGAPKSRAASIVRYEGFWRRYEPKDVGYEDAVHIRALRLCAYRLAVLYADRGDAKKCRRMIEWLEVGDRGLK